MAKKLWLPRIGRLLAILVSVFAFRVDAVAFVLDWDVVDWTTTWPTAAGGAVASQTFTNVNGSGINVTVSVTAGPNTASGSGAEALNPGGTAPNPALPDDLNGTPLTNGGAEEALMVDVNYTDRTNDYVQFTITFSQPVTNINFDLWDIDRGNSGGSTYSDVISTFVVNGGSPTNLSLSDNGHSDVDVSGTTLIGVASNGDTSALGNENDTTANGEATVSFGIQTGTSFSFRYTSGFGGGFGGNNSTLQRIALHDINFSAIPEVGSVLGALGVIGFTIARRRRSG